MQGVSITFFSAAQHALSRKYGDRLTEPKGFNRLINLLAEAEAQWVALPKVEELSTQARYVKE